MVSRVELADRDRQRRAASRSWATARIASPHRVRARKSPSPAMSTIETRAIVSEW